MCRTKKAIRILTAISFLSILAALGCGTYSPVAPSNTPTMPGVENPAFATLLPASKGSDAAMKSAVESAMISAKDGGMISNGYYSVYFAPGALQEDTEVSIEMPEFPKAIVRLSPHGIQFNAPVILSLDLGKAAEQTGEWDVLWLNDVTGLWESIGGYVEDGALKAELKHFSEYGDNPTRFKMGT
ncbi:MAG: hypothetical protein NTW97_00455 [Candidatus Krumholzibacteria bacterium]|nr:hypothetical protein [Candidatus Krumholzibacteria bacterium]